MNTVKKPPTVLDLIFWTITRLILWLVMGCVGCILAAVAIVAIKGETAGFVQLQAIAQADYHYFLAYASPRAIATLNSKLQQLPDSTSQPLLNAALFGAQLLVMRGYLLLAWSPLFLALGIVGFIDGLAQRYIRRMRAGRESALIYHHAKALILLSLMLGSFIALIVPMSAIDTELIMIGSALIFGWTIQITTKRFKKYL
ncbi:MAG: DUF4400 domain-containing protein [Gammaproteobacteria bacterium]|nr:DUF4400 domain-containing protein [Gammaproteobacteria bacterium]MBY0544841.1 DUF4400 domain-containing protein [Gammaproteobacteria bacterium]